MAIKILIKTGTDGNFEFKDAKLDSEFTPLASEYLLQKVVNNVLEHKKDSTKYYNIVCYNKNNNERLFIGYTADEISVDGATFTTYEALALVLLPIINASSSSGGSIDITPITTSLDLQLAELKKLTTHSNPTIVENPTMPYVIDCTSEKIKALSISVKTGGYTITDGINSQSILLDEERSFVSWADAVPLKGIITINEVTAGSITITKTIEE